MIFCAWRTIVTFTDNITRLNLKLYQEIFNKLGINCLFTITCHPCANGKAEQFSRMIASALRSYVLDNPHFWGVYSDAVTFAYNSQAHATIGLQPFELVWSRPHPLLVIELATPPIETLSYRDAKFRWLKFLNTLLRTQRLFRRRLAIVKNVTSMLAFER